MSVFERIVVGVDGRSGGRYALALAALLQRICGGEVIAVSTAVKATLPEDLLAKLEAELVRAGVAALPVVVADPAPARAAKRDREPGHVSDANLAVATRERSSWEPLDEVAPSAHLTRRTDRRVDETAVDLLALLDQRKARIGA